MLVSYRHGLFNSHDTIFAVLLSVLHVDSVSFTVCMMCIEACCLACCCQQCNGIAQGYHLAYEMCMYPVSQAIQALVMVGESLFV